MLNERRQRIMFLVAEEYLRTGKPVGSKAIAERGDVEWSASTVRNELAALERDGYLTHPHVRGQGSDRPGLPVLRRLSPGDGALARLRTRPHRNSTSRACAGRSRHDARDDAGALADDRFARRGHGAAAGRSRMHRIEVLPLQPNVAMVVVIASNGAVAKRVFNFERRLDPGLLEWASSYLNERLTGLALGARMTGDRLTDPELSASEASFLAEIGGAFTDLERRAGGPLRGRRLAPPLGGARARSCPRPSR